MKQFQVIFYEKEDGTRPAAEYIRTLSQKMRARVLKIATLLEENGPQLHMPHSEYLRDGIFQIRAQQEGNISRVLYFFAVGKTIVLTNGFTKKTQKTPPSEIAIAKKYKSDYEERGKKKC